MPVAAPVVVSSPIYDSLMIGSRSYEITNHLGNVLLQSAIKKIGNDSSGLVNYYIAEVLSQNDYYPFGMLQPGRSYTAVNSYRYGFNGKENDNEVKGEGNQQDYGMRIYDPRLGKFLSVDPLTNSYPWYTPYQFSGNSPIYNVDLDGLEDCPYHKTSYYKKNEKGEVVFEMLSDKDWNKREEDMRRAEMGYFVPKENTPNWARPVFGFANTLLTSVGALSELPAQAHYGDRIKPENRMHVFPLTGDGNIARLFAEAVTAPAYLLRQIIENPGDAEKWGELFGAVFLMRKVGGAKSLEATVAQRVTLANDFYISQGYAPPRTISHLEGINFGKAVQTTTLKKGTVIQQWVGENGIGDYFTSSENGTKQNLGVPDGYGNRTLKQFVLNEDVKVLKSTAADYKGQAGGGSQYFSAELKNKITEKK